MTAFNDLSTLDENVVRMMREAQNKRVCLCCGGRIPPSRKPQRYMVGYCSKNCYYEKPPKFAYAEKVYGKPASEVIIDFLNKNNMVEKTADLIGVSKPSMYKYLRKHSIKPVTLWGVNY